MAAAIVESMQKQLGQCVRPGEVGAAVNEEPRWGCNNRENVLQLRFVAKGVQEPSNERCSESVKVWNVLRSIVWNYLEGRTLST